MSIALGASSGQVPTEVSASYTVAIILKKSPLQEDVEISRATISVNVPFNTSYAGSEEVKGDTTTENFSIGCLLTSSDSVSVKVVRSGSGFSNLTLRINTYVSYEASRKDTKYISGFSTTSQGFGYLGFVAAGNGYIIDKNDVLSQIGLAGKNLTATAWQSGYFLWASTDGIWASSLANPIVVSPTAFTASEFSPDAIVGVTTVRNELVAINSTSMEVFNVSSNVPLGGFPFNRNTSGLLTKGAINQFSYVVVEGDTIAFVGSGNAEREALGVFIGSGGQTQKISTRSIDVWLEGSDAIVNTFWVFYRNQSLLFISKKVGTEYQHYVYDFIASRTLNTPVWSYLHGFDFGRIISYNGALYCGNDSGLFPFSFQGGSTTLTWLFSTIFLSHDSKGLIISRAEVLRDFEGGVRKTVTWKGSSPDADIKGITVNDDKKKLRFERLGHTNRYVSFSFSGDGYIKVFSLVIDVEQLTV